MQPSTISEPQPKRHIILKILMSVVLLAVVAGIAVLVIHTVHQSTLENEVKTELIKQNKLIRSAAKDNVYSSTLPDGVKTTDKVVIDATVSASGTAYCIEGTSKADGKIVFHMDKTTEEQSPIKGNCSDGATAAPLTPADVAVGSVGAGSVNLVWSKAPFAATYLVQCANDKLFATGLQSETTANTSISFEKLAANAQYYCRVAASNSLGQSEWSSVVSALTNPVSTAPTNLDVKTVSQHELSYSWDAVPGASQYVLEYSTDMTFMTNTVTVKTTATFGSLRGLEKYTAYYLHVKAVTDGFDAERAAFSGMVLGRTAE